MRVISMVPSWTETLLEAGADVVGRTRFCVHPKAGIESIPAVGGTKDWQWEKIKALKPDLLILDKEENPLFMAEQNEIPYVATHVRSVDDMPDALRVLALSLRNEKLQMFAEEWREVLQRPSIAKWNSAIEIPAILEWGRRPTTEIKKVIYLIWKDPWMAASRDTFVGSMLGQLGLRDLLSQYEKKYPEISLETESDKQSTLLLLSSEPYPFLKKRQGLDGLGFPYAFVDGESLSWFGVRSLRFLKATLRSSRESV